jgi:cathepsin X
MKAEIYSRGPVPCLINAMATSFDKYNGGIISCEGSKDPWCHSPSTDHYIILAGWGVDKATGTEYWIGRNSYGSHWGESAGTIGFLLRLIVLIISFFFVGGGWFRAKLGVNTLNLESAGCGWAVPHHDDVQKAIQEFDSAL